VVESALGAVDISTDASSVDRPRVALFSVDLSRGPQSVSRTSCPPLAKRLSCAGEVLAFDVPVVLFDFLHAACGWIPAGAELRDAVLGGIRLDAYA
jgi:hypothetical protein